jgi:hypothetical protein
MPDSYRPLREDDPVGTEVYAKHRRPHVELLGSILARHGMHAWVYDDDGPSTWDAGLLFVRVPDPWGELLEAAKVAAELLERYYPKLTTLRAAIAAAEQAARP